MTHEVTNRNETRLLHRDGTQVDPVALTGDNPTRRRRRIAVFFFYFLLHGDMNR
jgi:hypothetical protein